MANSYLSRDFGSAGNQKTMTFSWWYKSNGPSTNGQNQCVAISGQQQSYPTHSIRIDGSDRLFIRSGISAGNSTGGDITVLTTRKFKDHSWYHFVVAIDTTQATDTNRIKVYVNGVQETAFDTAVWSSQNYDSQFNRGHEVENIGRFNNADTYDGISTFTEGHFAHYHFIDGTAYAASDFGETDSTTGEWKAKLTPSVTYGSKGFFLKFENAGALGTDSSGNTNTWTVNGNVKQSISTPNNNFATFDIHNGYNTIGYAGTALIGNGGAWRFSAINYAMLKGKWYAEFKCVSGSYRGIGFFRYGGEVAADLPYAQGGMYAYPEGFFYKADSKELSNNNSETVYGSWSAINDGDILMLALDLDNGKAWYGVNGTWNDLGSGVGVPNTGAYPHQTFTTGTSNFWGIAAGVNSTYDNPVIHANFGEGRFGATALSSANNDNNSNGTFEYAPPAGFYSICTKNIKDYG